LRLTPAKSEYGKDCYIFTFHIEEGNADEAYSLYQDMLSLGCTCEGEFADDLCRIQTGSVLTEYEKDFAYFAWKAKLLFIDFVDYFVSKFKR